MKLYALMLNGTVAVVPFAHKGPIGLDQLGPAVTAAGLRMTPKIFSGRGWLRTDETKCLPTDVVLVQVWGKPDKKSYCTAGKAGQRYCWAPTELELIRKAYAAAGRKMDDYLPTMVRV